MDRLPALLTTDDFPEAELQALSLDGEVYRMDGCAASIDQPSTPELRAQVLVTVLPPRLIVELQSAAWVWGALDVAPPRHTVCADAAARARPGGSIPIRFREVVFTRADIVTVSGLRLTTPRRTAIDLARFADDWSVELAMIVRRLIGPDDRSAEQCLAYLRERPKLPRKLIALRRIADAVGVSPS